MPTPRPIEKMRDRAPPFFALLGGHLEAFDAAAGTCTIRFDISRDFCHSGDVVQGGFVTAMIDAAMSNALIASDDTAIGVSSLEISTRYLEVARAGQLIALGRIVRASYRTAFTEGELRDPDGRLIATAQMVSKLGRRAAES